MRPERISRAAAVLLASGSLLAGLLVTLGATPAVATVTTSATIRISAGSGNEGNRDLSAMNADGRYVVYMGSGAGSEGVYLYDQMTGTTTRLTTGNDTNPAISPEGNYVAYVQSGADSPVYLLDRQTGATTLQSVASDGTPAAGGAGSDFPSVSADGRYVAFQSSATNLGGAQSGWGQDEVYVHDNVTGATTMVSLTSAGDAANADALFPGITPDGRYVVFVSDAGNLLPAGQTSTAPQVYVHDTVTGATTLASVSSTGAVGNESSAAAYGPTISDNGQEVAFESDATNLVMGDTNGVTDAFVHNMVTDTTSRVSVNADGSQAVPGPGPAGVNPATPRVAGADPHISGDGSTVAFQSQAALTGSGDTNGVMDVYTYSLATGVVERMSVPAPGGTEATGTRTDSSGTVVEQVNGDDPSTDADGRYVSFTSDGDLADDRPLLQAGQTTYEPAAYGRIRNVPTLTGVSPPTMGLGRIAQVVTITGTNFTPPSTPGDLTVTFGSAQSGVTVTSVHWVSSTEVQATIDVSWDAPLGSRVVGVINPGNDVGSLPAAFTLTARGSGYRMASADGGIFALGDAAFFGSMGGQHLNQPIVGMAETSSGDGYWLVAADGGVFAFGDAAFFGSMGGQALNQPIVGVAATPDGQGYWEVARDGGVFAFGDAAFFGSMGGQHLNQPIVGTAATPDGQGYWEVARDGGVFAFGDAAFYGSMGGQALNQPIVGTAATPDGQGYWEVATDGGVFAFGDAAFYGSTGSMMLDQQIVGMAAVPTGGGYWLVAADGGVFTFGGADFNGSLGGAQLNEPIVAMSVE